MKRISGIILILIVLAAFTPLGCFADGEPIGLTCIDFQPSTNCVSDGNSITFTGSVILDLKGRSLTAEGITCDPGNNCSLTINDTSGGTVTLTKDGISVFGDIFITGGTVNATGSAYGIYAGNDLTISGGTVNATGYDYAISGMIVDISGGEVSATSTSGAGGNGSIWGQYIVTIRGGEVTAKASGRASAIFVSGTVPPLVWRRRTLALPSAAVR